MNLLTKALLESTPGPLGVFQGLASPEGTLVDLLLVEANPAAQHCWKLPDASAQTPTLSSLVPSLAPNSYRQILNTLHQTDSQTHWLSLSGESGRLSFLKLPDSPDILVGVHGQMAAIEPDTTDADHLPLAKQNELLRSVLDSSQSQIAAFEAIRNEANEIVDFRYVLQNETNRRTTQRDDHQVIGHTMLEYFPHTVETGVFAHYAQVADTGTPARLDIPYQYDGLSGYFDVSVVKWGDGIVLTIQDKPESWEAEQQRKHQAELLQRVIDHSPVGIILAEAIRDETGDIVDFRYLLTNSFNAGLMGLTVADMAGRLISSLFPNWQTIPLFETFYTVAQTGESQRYSFEYNHFGTRGWFEGSFIKHGDGVLFTFLDVSAIKQAEVDQEILANQLEAILDNSQTALSLHEAIRDSAGKIVDFRTVRGNRLAREIWGPLTETILAKPFSQVPNPTYEADFARYCRVVETGQPETVEFTYGPQTFLMATGKLGDGVVISFIDISEVRRSRQQLEVVIQELKRSNESLQQFAYVASHDLQEPLRKIMAFGDLLTERHHNSLDTNAVDLVQRMQQSARRMSMLIRDLLDYSRISTQKDQFEPINLNLVITDVLNDLDLLIRDSGASIQIEQLPTVQGSALQMQQLFNNLISNALKFQQSDLSPLVLVSCQPANPNELPSDLNPNGRYWQISVQDNGIGFEKQYAERIFQVFQRLHSKAKFVGTGVGLAICRRVVENHNGAIRATSELGKGSVFTIWLPA
ncbi:PAS domain-containing protein [Rudanella paleaurantiibacter]|uniref:histidine kinase n=1 Tax=Rudanella paleaurantiibacter TaxID=2614655 RepID=A0A7J5U0U1_9BACT|nr:ATP-binding protein [Rudanella paleaurantiibacter]KAB7731368.1 PAS domain-containing protein [Rudanella paleaurantiibacter]